MGDDTPNVNHHTTELATELEQRLRMIEATGITDPFAFSTSTIISATFPHSSRAGKEQVLINGNLTVTMYSRKGLPYGHYPRLVMFWLCREVLRRNANPQLTVTEARRIPLGTSLNGFLRDIGIIRGTHDSEKGGRKRASKHSYTALRNQLDRLFSTTISMDWKNTDNGLSRTNWDNVQISDEGFLWWDESYADRSDLADAYVLLSEKFFRDIIDHSVPFDALHLAGLSRYPMGIDLYGWASLRIATHSGFTRVTWRQLKGQLGTGYPDTKQGLRDFRRNARKALDEVKRVWPEAAITEWDNGLELRGNDPAVPKKVKHNYHKQFGNESPF